MDNLLPAWVHDGGLPKLLERLGDRMARHRIVAECVVDGERWGTISQGRVGFDEVMIATCRRHELEGLTLAALARQTGKAPAEALMDLLLEERATVGMVSFSQSLDNVATVLAHPAIMIGSDSIGLSEGVGLFSLETAVRKMTGMPAERLRFKDRGLLRPGYAADIAVFDPATVKDAATFQDPHHYAVGIPYVVVNGAVVVDGGRMHPAGTGRVLTPR
jgi:N-acyl-D-aspartate/D-glutamate deacylase